MPERFALEATSDVHRWRLPILPNVLTPAGALHGGAGLGAVVDAAERATGRPLVWATAPFEQHAGPSGTADIDVAVAVAGRHTTQVRATMRVGAAEVLSVAAALGRRDFPHGGTWVSPPGVPPPDACEPWPFPAAGREPILDHFEVRRAGGAALWVRPPGAPRPVDAGDAAVLGDFSMLALSDALGTPTTANSLDNTVRIVERPVADWVLVDIGVDAAAAGFGHLHARLWSDGGALIALASQTLVLRAAGSDGRAQRRGRRIVGGS
jgi:acyl-CoA thioesterase